ncbi:hypothetical protein D3C71_2024350 [compost metagenome]
MQLLQHGAHAQVRTSQVGNGEQRALQTLGLRKLVHRAAQAVQRPDGRRQGLGGGRKGLAHVAMGGTTSIVAECDRAQGLSSGF